MRAFVAVEVPELFRFQVAGLSRQLSAVVKGRFMRSGQYHVTLAFLGDIDERAVRGAMDALDAACAGRGPVRLATEGLGTFGKARDATLWLGLRSDEGLMELAGAVRAELAGRGIGFDAKPFKPHVTLARRATIPAADLSALAFPEAAEATKVTLFKSELSSEGATYSELHTCDLGRMTNCS